MAAVFLGQTIRKQDWLACVLSYLGVIVIATKGDVLGLKFDSPLGVGLALLSTLLWAGYWILNTKTKQSLSSVYYLGSLWPFRLLSV